MSTILIAGGSGLIGTRLSQLLQASGHQVIHLSRNENLTATFPTYGWDLEKGKINEEAIQKADVVVNLAGAGIADRRWTDARKKLIIDSRVKSNEVLLGAFERLGKKPKAFISASAVGYYGHRHVAPLSEDAAAGQGFLTESVLAWEKSVEPFIAKGIRTVILRVGIVLSTKGGAMQKMLPSYLFHLGAYFGDGSQYYSWIHIDDVCRMFVAAIDNEKMQGIYNAVGPKPATIREIAESIAEAQHKKALIMPVPAVALRLAMGEMADMLLFSTSVSAAKIEKTGFRFEHPDLVAAIRDLLTRQI